MNNQLLLQPEDKIKAIFNTIGEKCKNDERFKEEFLNDPTTILKHEGLELKPGASFQFVQTQEEAKQLPKNIIPLHSPKHKKSLAVDDLKQVSGGAGYDDPDYDWGMWDTP